MKFEIIVSDKNYRTGKDFKIRARSRKRAIKKIVLKNPDLKTYNFFFKYPAQL